jgi:hypothetical protein
MLYIMTLKLSKNRKGDLYRVAAAMLLGRSNKGTPTDPKFPLLCQSYTEQYQHNRQDSRLLA